MPKLKVALSRAHLYNKLEMEVSEIETKEGQSPITLGEKVIDEIAGAIERKTPIIKGWGQESEQDKKPNNNNYRRGNFNRNNQNYTQPQYSRPPRQGPASEAQIKTLSKKLTLTQDDYNLLLDPVRGRQYAADLFDKSKAGEQQQRYSQALHHSQTNNVNDDFYDWNNK